MKTLFTIFISFAIALLLSSCQKGIEQTENEGLPKCNIKGRIDSSGEYKVTVDKDCDTEFYSQSLLKGLNYEVEQNVSNSSISTLTNVGTPLQTKSNNTKPPYTLEQIEAHLTEMYRFDIEEDNGLKRWDNCAINYIIAKNPNELTNDEKTIIRDTMQKYSKITNVMISEGVPFLNNDKKRCNIGLIYTNDFLRTLAQLNVRKRLFPGYTDTEFADIYKQFKDTGQTSYGVLYTIKSKKINRMYVLDEVDDELRTQFKKHAEFSTFETFSLREQSGQSNVIKPSIMNIGDGSFKGKSAGILQPIDRYYLEALYSEQVYYGMPIKKAVKVMSRMIYQKLGGE